MEDAARAREILAKTGPEKGSARTATGTLRLGVLGEVRVAGAIVRSVVLARSAWGGWDLGATHRRRA